MKAGATNDRFAPSKRLLIAGWFSVVSGVVLFALAIVLPIIVQQQFVKQLKAGVLVTSKDSTFYDAWQQGLSDCDSGCSTFYMRYHVYNIKNKEDVLQGALPIFEERGPYVYREHKRKEEVKLVEEEEDLMLQYVPRTYFTWDQAASGELREDDLITVPSSAFWSVDAMLRSPDLAAYQPYVQAYVNQSRAGPFITLTVKEVLFGYHDPLLKMISDNLLPMSDWVAFVKNHSTSEEAKQDQGIWMEYSGRDRPWLMRSAVQVHGRRNYTDLSWKVPQKVQGCDGTMFAMGLTDRDKKDGLRVWEDDLYREIHLDYVEDVDLHGLTLWRFHLSPEALLTSAVNMANDQYYMDGPSGASDLSKPLGGTPVWVSLPHFLEAPYYYSALGGSASGITAPDAEKHDVDLRVEPHTGVTFDGAKRIQINMMLNGNHTAPGNCSWTGACGELRKNLLVPVYWLEEYSVSRESDIDELVDDLRNAHLLTMIFPCAAYPVGIAIAMIGGFLLVQNKKRTHYWIGWERRETNPDLYQPLPSTM
ncbi:hypothetical protein CYMTET_48161 [Cymbomonas tetramitiformis]|uniref:Uncharacterized protein n=1 Tax=Cymbomonas tetramitiformis TaxID=36881 RepID=A0AAE0BU40_9CHLO|nr:hypothetical protein CYMTET_48161 [Cymbomonas tetramitiformis]|eukprot:gene4775-5838_t